MEEIEKRKYEIGFVIKTEDAAIISQSLKNRGFVVLAENPLEKIQLAYLIKKESYAYFSYSHFEGDPAAIKELKEDLKLNPEVLRYLIITPPFIKKLAWRNPAFSETSGEMKFTPPVAKRSPAIESILTNEALEKKIEEILK
ncbi:MAG: 30S ribosomal protein S6 [bacterium]|nr:30S ribosomal protein S6 [bacterium]